MELFKNSDYYINKLCLEPHIEDGYYIEIYRSPHVNKKNKSILSTIYFMIKEGHTTHFRKLNLSDEVICYQKGKSMDIIMIDLKGNIIVETIGDNLEKGEKMQTVIPANYIACFKCNSSNTDNLENDFTLFTCVCGPAFNFEDFKICNIDEILNDYPNINISRLNNLIK